MLVKILREGLGRIIVFLDWLTRSKPLQRSEELQSLVDSQTASLSLYQFYACPFCIKTRRFIHGLNLNIAFKYAKKGSPYRDELASGGGKIQVPCLRVEDDQGVNWIYESSQINLYLAQRFGSS